MGYRNIIVEVRGRVFIVTINRPERRNAIDADTAEELYRAWTYFENNPDLYVGIITGAGGNFSSGADLYDIDRLMNRVPNPEGPLGFTRLRLSKPVIAAISGYCVAGGLEIALWADIRVADKTAKFGFLERRFGVPLVDGGTQRLVRIVGLGRALDLILTGRLISAEEAYQWGLVNYLVNEGKALDKSIEVAELISGYPQETLRNDRLAVYEGLGKPLSEGLIIEMKRGLRSIRTGEIYDGVKRFKEGAGRHGNLY
ncbi:crotonase/enoyl-CoA hydratase family protein [Vulcanisaeta distributa]|uniref:Enoyl-CoA hydratase/isomerase n=1 Tax=Vulcanisaeta distributa (strain DSM 14429 / JCM 11212 / NBRC 100878 / IC-017) TaxID=572478 RepID=E1QTQ7_VULDI|nr:Enoyl-CoA hydratase/isomerase [Vulcanisaeta distributa DSM 14429]